MMEKTICIWQVEVLSIQHKMSLPPSVYVNRSITQIVLIISKDVVIGHMNVTLWTYGITFIVYQVSPREEYPLQP